MLVVQVGQKVLGNRATPIVQQVPVREMRQLLDLYYIGDQQRTQMTKTYDLALERLSAMKQQRIELEITIAEFEKQLTWGASVIADLNLAEAAE